MKLQLALVAFLIWLTGACTGAIAYGLLMERALDAIGAELYRMRYKCESVAQSLQKCDSK